MMAEEAGPPTPQIGTLQLSEMPQDDGYILAQLPIGDTTLHVELIEVEVDAGGKVLDYVCRDYGERASAIPFHLNDNPDPEPLRWAGSHLLVLTDPVSR